jgi:hypothetical protein
MKNKIYLFIFIIFFGFFFKKMYYNRHNSDVISVTSNLKFHTIKFKKNKTSFEVTKNKNKNNYDFYVNSNFFVNKTKTIGGVIINGNQENSQINKGGSFIVKNKKPDISFSKETECEYLSQSIIWVIKENILNVKMLSQPHANKKVMRLLLGKNNKGEIILIHSNLFILVTMSDIVEYAKLQGIVDGIILDSGSSVDLKIRDKNYLHLIKALPFFLKKIINIQEPTIYITGNFI